MSEKLKLGLSIFASIVLTIIAIIYIVLGFSKMNNAAHIVGPIFLVIVGIICVGIFGKLAWTDIKRFKNLDKK